MSDYLNQETSPTERLLGWFDRAHRRLPWRETREPYAILVSEIMLQQTQVQTTIPYYRTFMARFPTLQALARAREQDVLKIWEGLGYYSRARNLKKTAEILCRDFAGDFPKTARDLQNLPGIGPYTSAAIASQAFDEVVPCVDGNVIRVVTRLCAWDDDIDKPKTRAKISRYCRDLLDPDRPGDTNQALMELGALICTPKNPKCPSCPVERSCMTRQAGDCVDSRPFRSPRKPPKVQNFISAFIECGDTFLIAKRGHRGLMAALWELPTQPGETAILWPDWLGADMKHVADPPVKVSHRFTHIQATHSVSVWITPIAVQPQRDTGYTRFAWIRRRQIDAYPVTRVFRKILRALDQHLPVID